MKRIYPLQEDIKNQWFNTPPFESMPEYANKPLIRFLWFGLGPNVTFLPLTIATAITCHSDLEATNYSGFNIDLLRGNNRYAQIIRIQG